MEEYFGVKLEFNRDIVDKTIVDAIESNQKGYVCSVESNNLTEAYLNTEFRNVLNSALVNICDGSVLAKIIGTIHSKPFKSYIGADLFLIYIQKRKYKQYFLGNTPEVLNGLQKNLSKIDSSINQMCFETLPFKHVDDFDYINIANQINSQSPDIIWVSLGAPKQEIFMSKLLPHLNRGVMFGFGAIFNFNANIETIKRAPKWMLKLKLEWLYRAYQDPQKNIPRYSRFIKYLPKMIYTELRNND